MRDFRPILMTLCLGAGLWANTAASEVTVDFPETNPVALGEGWDIDKAQKKFKSCITFDLESGQHNSTRLNYQQEVDNESLSRSLNVSASASFKSLTGDNYSASATFAQAMSFTSTSTYMSALAEVWVGPKYVVPSSVKFATPALQAMAKTNPAEFFRQCGTGFVSVMQRGAKMVAVLEFKGTTRDESQDIASTASYSGLTGGFDVSADSKMKKYQASNRFSIQATRSGGDGKTISLSLEELNQEIKNLPQQASSAPITFAMTVEPYTSLPDWPDSQIDVDLKDHQILSRSFGRLMTIWSYADEALKSKSGWLLKYDANRDAVAALKGDAQKGLEDIRARAKSCAKDDKCDVGPWQTWTDFDMRSRLPLRGYFSDLKLDDNNVDQIATVLARARMEQWIDDVETIRCTRYSECPPVAEYQRVEKALIGRIKAKLPL
ncbi:MAG TPA: hypothetical protein VJL88_04485 [Nitrospira sp.]|nr:hypothetical protein [Nitrospira sp.]